MDVRIFSVSEITRQIKLLLEDSFPALWVEGEISNFKPHQSGHLYFTLKDVDAQISCVMWRSRASTLNLELDDGLKVRVYGTLRLYEKSGRYQLDLIRIESTGLGELQLEFERLKLHLQEQGLFDPQHKKELPKFPLKVGIITSPTGAALHDILSVAKRRSPSTKIIIFGVKVQGVDAAKEIVNAINLFNDHHSVDVLIVGRGGGSLEDLWPFNDEIVARAIFDSHIPIVSAVGHEIDFTIADFVSDFRAPTPSAAAEIVLPADNEIREWIFEVQRRQKNRIKEQVARLRSEIINIQRSYSFRRPKDILQNDILQIEDITNRIILAIKNKTEKEKVILENFKNQLQSLNPYHVLNRGYSMVFKDEKLISSVDLIDVDDKLSVKLKDGKISSQVLSKKYE
jgi:exodeoxyribonuclease VII large subunit